MKSVWRKIKESERITSLFEYYALYAIATAIAIKVYICPDVEISFGFETSKWSGGKSNLWWTISPAEESGKFYKSLYALENRRTATKTNTSKKDGNRSSNSFKTQNKKAAAKLLGELLEKADAMYRENTSKPETLKHFARALNISESILVDLIQKVYSKNAEEWLIEKGYIVRVSDEEKLSGYLKLADENFERTNKRPENLVQFFEIVKDATNTVPKLIRSVYKCNAEVWLKNNGYIVSLTAEEKLAGLLTELRKRYPEGSELLSDVKEIQQQNSDLRWYYIKMYSGTSIKDWLITNGLLAPEAD